jgi:hypothetical protein
MNWNRGYDLVYADATNFGEFTPDSLTNMDINQSRVRGRCRGAALRPL